MRSLNLRGTGMVLTMSMPSAGGCAFAAIALFTSPSRACTASDPRMSFTDARKLGSTTSNFERVVRSALE